MARSAEYRRKLSEGVKRSWLTRPRVAWNKGVPRKGPCPFPTDSQSQSKRRIAQLVHEEAEADKLRTLGYEVFSPTAVCDRVAIKDGRVFFVEFKKEGQTLREGQQRVHDAAPDQYLIMYSRS